MTRHTIRTDDATIAYSLFGPRDGTPVTLIQGLGMPGAMWRGLAQDLADHDFRVALADNRGTGASRNDKPLFFMRHLADDHAAVLEDAFQGSANAIVAGISLGGMISQHIALRHGHLVEGLVLAATTYGLPHSLIDGGFINPQAAALLLKISLGGREPSPDEMQQLLFHPSARERVPEMIAALEDVFEEHRPTPPSTFVRQLLAALFHSTGGRLQQIWHPTTVITGDSDFLISPTNSRYLARRIPNAQLRVVKHAGHAFPFERPDTLRDAIIDLRERLRRTSVSA